MDKSMSKAEKVGATAGALTGLVVGGPGVAAAAGAGGYAVGKAWDSWRSQGAGGASGDSAE